MYAYSPRIFIVSGLQHVFAVLCSKYLAIFSY